MFEFMGVGLLEMLLYQSIVQGLRKMRYRFDLANVWGFKVLGVYHILLY